MKFNSLVIHGGIDGDKHTGAVTVPIYQTSTYTQSAPGVHKGFEYSRTGNPTRQALEKLIADLEEGSDGFAFSSGMAAISSVLMLFNSGDHIIFGDDLYGGTHRVINHVFKNFGIESSFVDSSNLQDVKEAIKPNTKAIFIETPSNPMMKVTDISSIAKISKESNLLLIVDNTFMTPYLQKPLNLGADIVLHSATKYLGGHSDLVAGLVAVNKKSLAEKLHFIQNSVGAILGPQDSWLLIKGIKTLPLRMDRHIYNTERVIEHLQAQSWVTKIHHPKFKSQDNSQKFGGMVAFEVKDKETLDRLIKKFKIFTFAESLGGVESLISVPAQMTHAAVDEDVRKELGITDTLMRASVGVEDIDDILKDLTL
ncbi:aminotransferase class I/II-fold pyridoxal phosphate-dependent enzyme [Proteinivorax tanatarense]|uniref:Aminotransferase class I/II-fold pyridoxal phosphate-dependent enzyme n=1 Tax=Proteinivorax tanatarense TaxID=1260629 RepID=A0AAU7VMH0_9FIRM